MGLKVVCTFCTICDASKSNKSNILYSTCGVELIQWFASDEFELKDLSVANPEMFYTVYFVNLEGPEGGVQNPISQPKFCPNPISQPIFCPNPIPSSKIPSAWKTGLKRNIFVVLIVLNVVHSLNSPFGEPRHRRR
ncbi:hypothetical protein ACROYT_G011687 [Oculina patagonica]